MKTISHLGAVLGLLLLAACNLPSRPATPAAADLVRTSAAQTVEAFSTRSALTPKAPTSTWVPQTSQTAPSATATIQPGTPAPSPTAGICDKVTFVRDITIPDGTTLAPGATFTKTWELKNSGTCIWNSSYSLVFANEGSAMNGPASQPLITSGTVGPDQLVQVSVQLTAPGSNGAYKGSWKLRNPNGATFGIGAKADQPFWVQIQVGSEPVLVNNLCAAEWRNQSGPISCPSTDAKQGQVYKLDAPRLENGALENEAALVVVLPNSAGSQISGRFPAIQVPAGAHFRSFVGCLDGATACNVTFTLEMQRMDTSEVVKLGEWSEKYDQSMQPVDIDLSPMAGKMVSFRLIMKANTASDQHKAFWLLPRLK